MRLSVTVTARARHERVERIDATHLRVAVTAPAHEGRANAAAVKALAAFLGVRPSRVRIVRGLTSRQKIVEVATEAGLPDEQGQDGRS
jgi:uncharacterized protein (TIGR00251 family)